MRIYFLDITDLEDRALKICNGIRVPNMGEEVYLNSVRYRVNSILTDLDNNRIQVYLTPR